MAPQSYAQRVIADGATNYWRLDEASGLVLDQVGGAHGTVTGGVTRGAPGLLADDSKAAAFDGVTGYITIPKGPYSDFGTGPFSFECWVRPTDSTVGTLWFLDCSNASTVAQGVSFVSDNVSYAAKVSNGTASLEAWNTLPAGQWKGVRRHLVGVVTRGTPDTLVLFQDGQAGGVWTFPANGWAINATQGLKLGTWFGGTGPDNMLYGVLDEVAFYRVALSPAQILAHYQLGVGQFASMPQPSTAGLPLVDKPLLVGQAVLGASAGVDVAGCADLKIVVVGNGPVSAGMVTIEEAHDTTYAGTWAIRAGIPAQPGTTVLAARETAKAIRARVSTAIVGGSVSVYLVAR